MLGNLNGRTAKGFIHRATIALRSIRTVNVPASSFTNIRNLSSSPVDGDKPAVTSDPKSKILKEESKEPSTLFPKVSDFIKQVINENEIVVFMKGTVERPMCGYSRLAIQVLRVVNVPRITSVNVLEAEDLREGVKKFTSWPTIPQVFVKGEFIGGSDIILNMYQSGELQTLLKEKGIDIKPPENDPLEPPIVKK